MEIQLTNLREEIMKMASFVDKAVHDAFDQQITLADLFQTENEINRFHSHTDELCFKFIALMKPAARDLRTALAVMKMGQELERMGDQAVKIKRAFSKLTCHYEIIDNMKEEVLVMTKNVVDSFVAHDIKLATDVLQHDSVVDELNRTVIRNFLERIGTKDCDIEEGFRVINVARDLERIADHATNIAEDIIFLESGRDVRHPKTMEQKFHE
jgi:phosphate transport system protein